MLAIADRWIAPTCHAACLAALCDALISGKTTDAAVLCACFGEVLDVLNEQEVQQQFAKLPAAAVQAWLGCDQLRTDSENSVVVALALWLEANGGIPMPASPASPFAFQPPPFSKHPQMYASIRVPLLTPSFARALRTGGMKWGFEGVAGAGAFEEAVMMQALSAGFKARLPASFSAVQIQFPGFPAAWLSTRSREPPAAAGSGQLEWGVAAREIEQLLEKAAAGPASAAGAAAMIAVALAAATAGTLTSPVLHVFGWGWSMELILQKSNASENKHTVGVFLRGRPPNCLHSSSTSRTYYTYALEAKEASTGAYSYKRKNDTAALYMGHDWGYSDFFKLGCISSISDLKTFTCSDGMIHLRAKVTGFE